MLPASAAFTVESKTAWISDAELSREVAHDTGGHLDRIVEEGAQEPHGAELDSEPEAHVIPALGSGQLPVSIIKVDRSFVASVGGDGTNEPIVRAVLAMTRAMGQRVVAEGVETEVQRDCPMRPTR